ncbi:MAG: hypothetical protein QN122_03930 [Armatimonadota bacterium]|nr:hypothetical protein [Armatimonadota bacterium]MDR7449792.1 hypothetical protein [Armatimonadota bacterium]MDR7458429.1 hypothetical protein [Armatimonadota bacterium]MDR7478769.1 hypothetical protein [Armatimonadota bacterium]MDR7488227.1 hypothetical protein [Armatimonadota bacterium]
MRMLMLGMVLGMLVSGLALLTPIVLAQGVPPLQEFIPLPGPGDRTPGTRPGQPQPGQGDCPILFYYNGQLYELRPGQGPEDGPGRPGSPPEFFYLNPYRGPAIPGLPQPGPGPNFQPVQPRS